MDEKGSSRKIHALTAIVQTMITELYGTLGQEKQGQPSPTWSPTVIPSQARFATNSRRTRSTGRSPPPNARSTAARRSWTRYLRSTTSQRSSAKGRV